PRAAPCLGHERIDEARLDEVAPERIGPLAAFDPAHGLGRAAVGQQLPKGVSEFVVHDGSYRRPRPRAIIPRNTSRVPPRSENAGPASASERSEGWPRVRRYASHSSSSTTLE